MQITLFTLFFFPIIWMNLFRHRVLTPESTSLLNVGFALHEERLVIQTNQKPLG